MKYGISILGWAFFAIGCGNESPVGSDSDPVADAGAVDDGGDVPPGPYVAETRTIEVGGEERSFLVALPDPAPSGLPLVFSFHGDGGSAAGFRTSLDLEAEATTGAVFVYPNSLESAFEYYTYEGRTREADLVTALIASLSVEFGIDTNRVFVTGMSGGAVMANAVACRLERAIIRGIGVHSGSLYSTDSDPPGMSDFSEVDGAASCDLPSAILIWGTQDMASGTTFADDGLPTLGLYVNTAQCENSNSTSAPEPCVAYDDCDRPVVWCAIEGMGHSIWPGAANAIWGFFDGLR